MTSYLIISTNLEKAETYTLQFCKEKGIDIFDITNLTIDKEKKASVGIEEVRKFQEKLQLKPFKSEYKAAIIYDAHTITIEGQNALLKTLEEPPAHTYIFLVATTQEAFLPTILSRCKVISLDKQTMELTEQEREEYRQLFTELPTATIGKKLSLAQKHGTNKEEALIWLEKTILYLREVLIKEYHKPADINYLPLLISFQEAYKTIKTTNVSPRFILEDTIINIPSKGGD